MREIRHEPVKDQVTNLNQVLRGHYAYYGVAGNLPSLHKVHRAVERYWHKMLCSRSWKSYMPWEVFVHVKTCFPLLRPRFFLPYARLKSYAVL
jgi:RNA-directed DNA polymerase